MKPFNQLTSKFLIKIHENTSKSSFQNIKFRVSNHTTNLELHSTQWSVIQTPFEKKKKERKEKESRVIHRFFRDTCN